MKLQILVPSFAGFADCWLPFARCLKLAWPDCPWPTVLVTDRVPPDGASGAALFDEIIASGQDEGWCRNLDGALDRCLNPDDFILLAQEDFFLTEFVEVSTLIEAAEVVRGTVGCFRVLPCPGAPVADRRLPSGASWGLLPVGMDYRISCQPAIWRVRALRDALSVSGANGTAADFEETPGSGRSARMTRTWEFASVAEGVRPFPALCSGVTRGAWNPDALRLFEWFGIPRPTSGRPICS